MIAYGIYLVVSEAKVDGDLGVIYPVDVWTFWYVLSVQMLEYDPKNCHYLGDNVMHVCTKQRFQEQVSPTILLKQLKS